MNATYSVLLLAALFVATGCSSGGSKNDDAASETGAAAAADVGQAPAVRARGVTDMWAAAQGKGDAAIDEAREEMKKIVWKGGAPQSVREAALDCLLSDTRPGAQADTANMLRLRMPTEPSYGVLKYMCGKIAERASDPVWQKTVTGLVRSWSRKLPSPPDDQRPERAAIAALYPSQGVEDTVFAVFVDPVAYGAQADSDGNANASVGEAVLGNTLAPDSAKRIRQAAWDLLGRIDQYGERRTKLLEGGVATNGDRTLETLVQSARELHVVPLTGSELSWLEGVRTSKDAKDTAWWSEVSSRTGSLGTEELRGLQFRHLEAVRWAGANRAVWLSMDLAGIRSELQGKLEGRRTYRVGQNDGVDFTKNRNRIRDWEESIVWGDYLTMLVLDEAVQSPSVVAELFKQAEADRADTSTEWGGCLFDGSQCGGSAGGEEATGFVAVPFAPRPAQRINDRTFVASDDMFGRGGRSLAHYHFHAQSVNNQSYAGPGAGDADYADLHNRNCLVFTPVRPGKLNVDYYQRGGATIDLGEIAEPK